MENKYEIYINQQLNMFADEWCAVDMSTLMALNDAAKEFAKAVHHAVKEPEKAQALIEQIYDIHYNRIQFRPPVLREALPPLPPGVHAPLPLLADGEERGEQDA